MTQVRALRNACGIRWDRSKTTMLILGQIALPGYGTLVRLASGPSERVVGTCVSPADGSDGDCWPESDGF